ncbi:MAG: alpha/beta hydrolase fold domain-containing protein [Muribaculaceae bacterium]|nr:alpha/beta hydrolase fold domain-containing protein [Muribaculaceae bacterium]
MKITRILLSLILSATLNIGVADNFTVSDEIQTRIQEEAEDWMDNMQDGIQDRMSDAVNHAIHGFYTELDYFRNYSDTTGINKYKTKVREIPFGNSVPSPMFFYYTEENIDTLKPLLIYFHGGGWVLGSHILSDKFCRALASDGKINVISIDYPLSPEKVYPTAIDVSEASVNYITEHASEFGSSKNLISLGGDGAGGNIAIMTYQRLANRSEIKSMVLYYPLIKAEGRLNQEMKKQFGRGYGFDSRLWEVFVEAYKGKSLPDDITLPPTLLISAGRDIIIEEQKEFVATIKNVTYVEFPYGLHGFITDNHQTTAFETAVVLTEKFLMENK